METLRLTHADDPASRAQAHRLAALLATRCPVKTIESRSTTRFEKVEPLDLHFDELQAGSVDAVICGASRLPAKLPPGIALGALFRDRDPRSLCAADGPPTLALLPTRSRVAVCDAVSRAQILHRFPWLYVEVMPDWCEVLEEIRYGGADAGCLPAEALELCAASGLRVEALGLDALLPTIGQGVIAVLTTATTASRSSTIRDLDQPEVRAALAAERTFVQQVSAVTGGLGTARAQVERERLILTGLLAERDGTWLVTDQGEGSARFASALARDVADACSTLFQAERARVPIQRIHHL